MPTDSIRDTAFCDVLNRELVCALGCTEPIAVAYASALASQTLGCEPDHMDVACSGNIIKNVKSVTVPNSGGMHGIEAAAVLGAEPVVKCEGSCPGCTLPARKHPRG